jgi:hypothetical protein
MYPARLSIASGRAKRGNALKSKPTAALPISEKVFNFIFNLVEDQQHLSTEIPQISFAFIFAKCADEFIPFIFQQCRRDLYQDSHHFR